MTADKLNAQTRKELAELAKRHRIGGWHGMSKAELVRALVSLLGKRSRTTTAATAPSGVKATRTPAATPAVTRRAPTKAVRTRELNGADGVATSHLRPSHLLPAARTRLEPGNGEFAADHLQADAFDPYWIRVRWSLSQAMLARSRAALGMDWHDAVPVIRLIDVTGDEASLAARCCVREIEIEGKADSWYVPVDQGIGRTYRLQIGYRGRNGRFFQLAQSATVRMPRAGARGAVHFPSLDELDEASTRRTSRSRGAARRRAAAAADAALTLRAGREISATLQANASNGSAAARTNGSHPAADFDSDALPFELDAELVLHGATHPMAELTLLGTSVPVARDGSFSLRFSLPNGRQVIPAVTVAPDGAHQRTIVLAIEKSTRILEPQPVEDLGG